MIDDELTNDDLFVLRLAMGARLRNLGGRADDPRTVEGVHPVSDPLHAKGLVIYDKLGRMLHGDRYPH